MLNFNDFFESCWKCENSTMCFVKFWACSVRFGRGLLGHIWCQKWLKVAPLGNFSEAFDDFLALGGTGVSRVGDFTYFYCLRVCT